LNDVRISAAAVHDLISDDRGIVAGFLRDLSEQAASIARAKVPVRREAAWSLRSNARPPGFTKARIHTRTGHSPDGAVWASANAPADPAIFLEDPAEQLSREYPFLTTGLWSLEGTF